MVVVPVSGGQYADRRFWVRLALVGGPHLAAGPGNLGHALTVGA